MTTPNPDWLTVLVPEQWRDRAEQAEATLNQLTARDDYGDRAVGQVILDIIHRGQQP